MPRWFALSNNVPFKRNLPPPPPPPLYPLELRLKTEYNKFNILLDSKPIHHITYFGDLS